MAEKREEDLYRQTFIGKMIELLGCNGYEDTGIKEMNGSLYLLYTTIRHSI